MKTWSTMQARRGLTLEGFLKNVISLDEALKKFKVHGIIPPSIESIEDLLGIERVQIRANEACEKVQQIPTKGEDATRQPVSTVDNDEGYDEIIIIETKERIADD